MSMFAKKIIFIKKALKKKGLKNKICLFEKINIRNFVITKIILEQNCRSLHPKKLRKSPQHLIESIKDIFVSTSSLWRPHLLSFKCVSAPSYQVLFESSNPNHQYFDLPIRLLNGRREERTVKIALYIQKLECSYFYIDFIKAAQWYRLYVHCIPI